MATTIAIAWRHTAVISIPMGLMDDLLYDTLYQFRTPEDRRDGPVVIVAIGEPDLDRLNRPWAELGDQKWPWPWPREFYGEMLQYLQRAGARVVVFDMLFSEASIYQRQQGDDGNFAEMVNELTMPVVFGTVISDDGKPGRFELPVDRPILGGVNDAPTIILRTYRPLIDGFPSLAYRAVELFTKAPPRRTRQFLMHYYGPYEPPPHPGTHRYVGASDIIFTVHSDKAQVDLDPKVFRDKIVVIGGIAANLQDIKATPVSKKYPGVEWQATAIENMLEDRFVSVVPFVPASLLTLAASLLTAGGTLIPRRNLLKLSAAALVTVCVLILAGFLFHQRQIRYLPLATPLMALLFSTIAAFAWSYFTEDRQRRFILKALSQAVSPEVAEQIARDPSRLRLGGERRTITVMFTDISGFTDVSEKLEPEKLAELMHTYFEEMSQLVLDANGTLDKYIGDSIMSFWNAPLDQAEHAYVACRTALGMAKRERDISAALREIVDSPLMTRIGINTGPMVVGNLGSSHKFQYTVLGDSVNLGARLEGANKRYGSQILMAQSTAELVRSRFIIRELDWLAVKGKLKPVAVYELLGEGVAEGDLKHRIDGYEAALADYRAQRWLDAEAKLMHHIAEYPDDAPADALLAQTRRLRDDPPGEGWNGVSVAKEK